MVFSNFFWNVMESFMCLRIEVFFWEERFIDFGFREIMFYIFEGLFYYYLSWNFFCYFEEVELIMFFLKFRIYF